MHIVCTLFLLAEVRKGDSSQQTNNRDYDQHLDEGKTALA
jgi:hypothetical protein